MKRIGCMGIGRPERPNSSKRNKQTEISNSGKPLPGKEKENISCYQILAAGVTWKKLEASSI